MDLENDFYLTKQIRIEKTTHFEGLKITGRILTRDHWTRTARHELRQPSQTHLHKLYLIG